MDEGEIQRSASVISPEKLDSSVMPRSLKAASSIVKSLTSLASRKSQSSNIESGSQSSQLIQKSVSIVPSEKFPSNNSLSLKNKSGQEMGSKIAADDNEVDRIISIEDLDIPKPFKNRKQITKFMSEYPELFRNDVSINPSYTGLRNFPYNVTCRRRFHKNKSKINHQLTKEIENITMMQTLALDGVRVGRIFSVGFHPSQMIVKDFATPKERRRLNEILRDR